VILVTFGRSSIMNVTVAPKSLFTVFSKFDSSKMIEIARDLFFIIKLNAVVAAFLLWTTLSYIN
jgi:hypothetical protein